MQQMLGKLAWEEEGRENRESKVTLPQEATEGNDSEMFQQVLDRQFGIAKDGPKKTGTNCLAGVHRDSCDPSVRVPEENVTAAGSNELKADSFEDSDDFLALQPGKPRHTEIC